MSAYKILKILGYKLANGGYGTRKQARESGIKSFDRYAKAKCPCGLEKVVQIRNPTTATAKYCASCAAKIRHGTDRFNTPVCLSCGGALTRRRHKYCSRECLTSSFYTEAEEEYMRSLDIYPAEVAISKFKQYCSLHKRPQRKRSTVKAKFATLDVKFAYAETHFTRAGLCRFVGVSHARGVYLLGLGMPFKPHRKHLRISTKDLREWLVWNKNKALFFPYLDGCDLEKLEYLIGADLFTQYQRWEAKGLIRRFPTKAQPIRVEGVEYPSIENAGKHVPMSCNGLRLAAKGVTKDCSLSVEFV